ncbi:MAG: ATP-binding protein [bacterium]
MLMKSWRDIESDLLEFSMKLSVPAGAAIVIFALLSWSTWQLLTPLPIAATAFLVLTAVVRLAKSRFVRKCGLVGGVWLVGMAGLVQLGPLIGAGFVLGVFVGLATVFFGRKGSIASYLISVFSVAATWWWADVQAWPIDYPWMRVWLATVLGLGTLAMLTHYFVVAVQTSIATAELNYKDRLDLEAQRERLLKHAMQAERLESLGLLAGGVAHDFNNSLVVIRGGIDMLEDIVPKEEAELIAMMRESADAAAETARSLMTFARQQVAEAETCRPHEVLDALSRKVRKLFNKSVTLSWELDETPPVNLGPRYLEDSVLQLLSNARDAMSEGGTVVVGCRVVEDHVEVSVADQGKGISPRDITRVFEPFYTTKGEQATGLGLALVWGHLQKCGGDVAITSELGEGTTVTLVLPVANT